MRNRISRYRTFFLQDGRISDSDVGQMSPNPLDHHIQGDLIVAADRNDHISVFFAGLNVKLMHRLDSRKILIDDAVQTASSFFHITDYAPEDPHICVRVHEDLYVELLAKRRILKDQDPFDKDNPGRFDAQCLLRTVMDAEIIDRTVYGMPVSKLLKRFDQKIGVKRIRMIIVEFFI